MKRQIGKRTCVIFDAQTGNLDAIRDFVMTAAEASDFPREAAAGMIQAVDEAVTNIIVHGYRGIPGIIEVEVMVDEDALAVRLRDDAPAFDPTSVAPLDLDLPVHMRSPGGLGVYLMRQFADRISYRHTETGQND